MTSPATAVDVSMRDWRNIFIRNALPVMTKHIVELDRPCKALSFCLPGKSILWKYDISQCECNVMQKSNKL